jgi:hypothetical protein
MNRTIEDLAASFATLEGVEALVLAGSMTSGLADEGSDYDLRAYTREAVPLEFRARLLKPRAARLELHTLSSSGPTSGSNPTAPSSTSCTARAISSRPTSKLGWAGAKARWATPLACATRFYRPSRCSIAKVGLVDHGRTPQGRIWWQRPSA